MSEQAIKLNLTIQPEEKLETEELAELTQQLREELLELDVEGIEVPKGKNFSPGGKGDPVTWGQLILTLLASGGVFTALIPAVQAWVTRNERLSVILEIDGDRLEITGISPEQQKLLVDEWLRRHPELLIPK